jgi:N-acetylneuraminic acid mutarotase
MKLKFLNRFTSLALVSVIFFGGAMYIAASDGFTASYNVAASVTGPDSVCKKITNTNASGLSEYIPTATVGEWQSFVAHPPTGVTVGVCPSLAINSWTNLGLVLPGVLANSQSAVIGGNVYLFGGRTSQTTVTGAIYRASTANLSSWVAAGNLPGPVHSGQLYNDGTFIYMFGGRSGETASDTTFLNTIYRASVADPLTWTTVGSLPSKLAYSQLVVPGDGFMYLLGGSTGYLVFTSNIYRAPVSNPLSWTLVGTLPATINAANAAVIGNYIYIFGGRTNTSNYLNTIYRAPVSNPLSWSLAGTIPNYSGFSSFAQIGDYIYLLGGYRGTSPSAGSSNADIYRATVADPLTWTNWSLQLPAGFDSSSPQVIGNFIYLISGAQNTSWATQYVYRGTIQ